MTKKKLNKKMVLAKRYIAIWQRMLVKNTLTETEKDAISIRLNILLNIKD